MIDASKLVMRTQLLRSGAEYKTQMILYCRQSERIAWSRHGASTRCRCRPGKSHMAFVGPPFWLHPWSILLDRVCLKVRTRKRARCQHIKRESEVYGSTFRVCCGVGSSAAGVCECQAVPLHHAAARQACCGCRQESAAASAQGP